MSGRAIIQSREGAVLAAVRERAPEIERALLLRMGRAQPWVADGTATIVSRKAVWLRRGQVGKLRRRGARIIPYTVNKPAKIRKLLDWGVDGVITDYPDRVLEALLDAGRHTKPGETIPDGG